MNFKNLTIMMKKEYLEPAIDIMVVLAEQLLAASNWDLDDDDEAGEGEAKPAFSIWEYIESKE